MAGAVEQILRRMKDNSTRDVLGRKVRRVNHSLFMIDGEAFLSVRSAAALFGEGALGEGRYYEPQRVPKWSGRPSVLKVRGGPLTRRVFHELTKEQHLERAYEMARKAAEQRMAYRRALDSAISRYGDIPRGTQPISGIYNQAFPAKVKERLRAILADVNDFTDASVAHYEASGKRTPWRDSPLRAIAVPEGSYY